MYLGVDDTDSVKGMCTTYLATELIREFAELDLIGNPRLVRLNPNVPWKTRGNGAVSLRFGKGQGLKRQVGEINGEPIFCYERGIGEKASKKHLERASQVIEKLAYFDDEKTNPGLILTDRKPSANLYWQAVRTVVEMDSVIQAAGPKYCRKWKNGRGLIGSVCGTAWRPRDYTYEIIAYREPDKWGTPRHIQVSSVKKMDKAVKTTFNNYDYEEKHMAIMPNSPCPILFGIRGDSEQDLHKAKEIIQSEKIDRWIIYQTNQGTDDHIMPASISSLEPFTSIKVKGKVASIPEIIEGGHLIFSITNGRRAMHCTVYEPAKSFRFTADKLRPGDIITIYGGVREEPFTINVEKLHVEKVARYTEKTANPMCKKCQKRMKSIGKGQGYRCAICGKKVDENQAEFSVIKREITKGWYEPPVGSRRHLSMPLKRQQKQFAILAADHAEKYLHYFEDVYPDDDRPKKAIEAARAWANHEMKCGEARKAALAAHAAARDAEDKKAEYAARAAGHAAATAHVMTHAPGARWYTGKIKD